MSKYSYEFKKEVVDAYFNGEGGYRVLAKKYNVLSRGNVQLWINSYKAFGYEGLKHSHKNKNYSFEKKLYVVKLYLSSEISYQELAIKEGITRPQMIAGWVNRFRAEGPDGLRSHRKGRKKTLDKPKTENKTHEDKEKTIDTSVKHVKELEKELLNLRIENAFLKEMRRLRLEDEAKMRERRSSSTVSEENSN